jgi:hypothetical protein
MPLAAFGQNKEFTIQHKYTASNDDSKNSAKGKAMAEAQAELLQQIGILVEARQKMATTNSGQNFAEEIKSYTAGKVQTQVINGTEEWSNNVYSATFKMIVDTAGLYRHLDNIIKQKEQERLANIRKEEQNKQFEKAKSKEGDALKALNIAKKKLDDLKTQEAAAENEYKRTISASNSSTAAGMETTKKAMVYLTETRNKYNEQEEECKKLETAYEDAKKNTNQKKDSKNIDDDFKIIEAEFSKAEADMERIFNEAEIKITTNQPPKLADTKIPTGLEKKNSPSADAIGAGIILGTIGTAFLIAALTGVGGGGDGGSPPFYLVGGLFLAGSLILIAF